MKYIGIDVHKRISTVCVIDENSKTESELSDIETSAEGFTEVTERYRPDQCRIMTENSACSHFVQRHFEEMGYDIMSVHPADFPEIAKSAHNIRPISPYERRMCENGITTSKNECCPTRGLCR